MVICTVKNNKNINFKTFPQAGNFKLLIFLSFFNLKSKLRIFFDYFVVEADFSEWVTPAIFFIIWEGVGSLWGIFLSFSREDPSSTWRALKGATNRLYCISSKL